MLEQKPSLIHRCQLKTNEQVTGTWHCLKLHAPDLCGARPGQFVHVRVGASSDPLLRRPFSIHHVVAEKNEIWLLVRSVGAGTELLLQARPGAVLDLLGPLGTVFPPPMNAPALLAGGYRAGALITRSAPAAGAAFERTEPPISDPPADDYFARTHPLMPPRTASIQRLITGCLAAPAGHPIASACGPAHAGRGGGAGPTLRRAYPCITRIASGLRRRRLPRLRLPL